LKTRRGAARFATGDANSRSGKTSASSTPPWRARLDRPIAVARDERFEVAGRRPKTTGA
jgi:hypothetical protein